MADFGKWASLLFAAVVASCPCSAQTAAYDGDGAVYVMTDRTVSFQFLDKIAKYNYIYPTKPISGQKFSPDESDTIPNLLVRDCSNSDYNCLAIEDQAMAVPKRRLAIEDNYVAFGDKLSVVKCLRGYRNLCQVALIKSECIDSAVAKGCIPKPDDKDPNSRLWLIFFIYNEDFGVTSYGIAPSVDVDAPLATMMSLAQTYNLVGDNGLLKPTP